MTPALQANITSDVHALMLDSPTGASNLSTRLGTKDSGQGPAVSVVVRVGLRHSFSVCPQCPSATLSTLSAPSAFQPHVHTHVLVYSVPHQLPAGVQTLAKPFE